MTKILIQGCKSGLIAGSIWGLLMLRYISPMIHEAEKYEQVTPLGGNEISLVANVAGSHSHEHHHHDDQEGLDDQDEDQGHFAPQAHHHHHSTDGASEFEPNYWQRPFLTVLGSSLMGIAFGILMALCLGIAVRFNLISKAYFDQPLIIGSIFGFFGFLVFQGIPSMGLPPMLPGVIGAENDYAARQSWWTLCVLFSSLGVMSLFGLPAFLLSVIPSSVHYKFKNKFKNKIQSVPVRLISFVLALILIAIPFVSGVPAHSEVSPVPSLLKSKFIWASTGVNGLFWLVLGSLLFYFVCKESRNAALDNKSNDLLSHA